MCAFYYSEIGYDTFAISHWLTELLAYLIGGSILLQVESDGGEILTLL
jgi:hypothetical protein